MTTKTTTEQKIMSRAEELFCLNYSKILPKDSSCLMWTAATIAACSESNVKAVLQAGTTMFRIVHPDDDDGIRNDYFSYKFVQSEAVLHMMRGNFPEMHVWVYLPDSRTIVDMAYHHQPVQCKKLTGLEWDERLLPDGPLCRTVDELDADEMSRVIYQADSLAISMAIALLKQFHRI